MVCLVGEDEVTLLLFLKRSPYQRFRQNTVTKMWLATSSLVFFIPLYQITKQCRFILFPSRKQHTCTHFALAILFLSFLLFVFCFLSYRSALQLRSPASTFNLFHRITIRRNVLDVSPALGWAKSATEKTSFHYNK